MTTHKLVRTAEPRCACTVCITVPNSGGSYNLAIIIFVTLKLSSRSDQAEQAPRRVSPDCLLGATITEYLNVSRFLGRNPQTVYQETTPS